jgi:putative NADH-flavin reductase
MKLAIFGATGTAGAELLTQALDAGHEVRVLARTPSKLPANHPRLTAVQGNVRDLGAVKQTVAGTAAVLSTLGATDKHDPDVRRTGTANIITAMNEQGIRRLVVMGGFHLRFPGDPDNLGRRLIVPILRLTKYLVEDTTAMGALVQSSDVDWTVVRTPRLARGVRPALASAGILELGPWSKVTRANVASFMLRCLHDDASVRQAPMICNRMRVPGQVRSRRTVGGENSHKAGLAVPLRTPRRSRTMVNATEQSHLTAHDTNGADQ